MRGVNVNMFYDDLNTEEQVSYLIKPSNAEYQKEVWQECCVEGNEP